MKSFLRGAKCQENFENASFSTYSKISIFVSRTSIATVAVTHLTERPFKGPGLEQLNWCGFESQPQHKVVGKNSSFTICEANIEMSAR